ncbi:MAG: hypothetical protein LAN18_08250 [Acidobacteriia bacterium]|nr:hypothetical protein [Terriglobia bacterium]
MRGIKSVSLLDGSFRFSITLKGLRALLETILGIAVLNVDLHAMREAHGKIVAMLLPVRKAG